MQQTPDPLACCRAPSEVQCGVSSKKLTEGGKIAGCGHILTGLVRHFTIQLAKTNVCCVQCFQ